VFTGAKITKITQINEITGKQGLFPWPFFSFSHTRLGRGARDWGQMLTTLVILRTSVLCILSLSLSHVSSLSFPLNSPIREVILKVLRQLESEVVPSFTTRF
jgi:hypothetical protein